MARQKALMSTFTRTGFDGSDDSEGLRELLRGLYREGIVLRRERTWWQYPGSARRLWSLREAPFYTHIEQLPDLFQPRHRWQVGLREMIPYTDVSASGVTRTKHRFGREARMWDDVTVPMVMDGLREIGVEK